jgi:hypothetical protein
VAKSKYSEEVAQKIFDTLAATGRDEDGWKAGGIGKDTFYRWIREYKEFSDGVKRAKSEWHETCPEVLVRQANRAFGDYLFGRMEKVVYTKKEGIRGDQPFEEEITQRVPVGIPRWAIERVLGTKIHELEALKTLVDAGWLPRWVIQVAIDELDGVKTTVREVFTGILPDGDVRKAKPGLSDAAAAAIRTQILGIQSTSSPPVSTAVDRGQKQN